MEERGECRVASLSHFCKPRHPRPTFVKPHLSADLVIARSDRLRSLGHSHRHIRESEYSNLGGTESVWFDLNAIRCEA